MIYDNTLIYDIETRTFGRPNSEKDIFRVFGCYSYKKKKYYVLTKLEEVQKIVNAHKYLVGFNIKGYDNPILKRAKIKLEYKYIIDLRDIIFKRAGEIKIKEGLLKDLIMEYSLDYISKLIGVVDEEAGKKDIDYNIFKKDTWTEKEIREIQEYTKRDVEVTKKMYEWVEEYFKGLKDFVRDEDIKNKKYLTVRTANVAYKAICKAMDWEESYGEGYEDEETIGGGYVAYPAGENFEGDIYCLDFNSLYPHIMIQCNLYGRREDMSDRETWTGGGKWKVDGAYYTDEIAEVGKLLQRWFKWRLELKAEKNPKEHSIKIMLNVVFGILDKPAYARVYDQIAAGDCTGIGRQWAHYSRKIFREEGYKVIYTDTDSFFIIDTFKDKEKMLKVKDKIISEIKGSVPFPQETFDMGIDDEISHMFFFKGDKKQKEDDEEMDSDDFVNKAKGLLKKNYIYVTKEGKVIIKNLGIRKKSNSPLSRKIFWEYLVPGIKKGKCKFSKTHFKNLISELLEKDYTLAAMRKNVGNISDYEKSPSSIQAQITRRYGSGIHFLIPNTKGIGVGKGKSFCTKNEFMEHNMKWTDIDTDNVWKELKYFILPVKTVSIFDFEKKK